MCTYSTKGALTLSIFFSMSLKCGDVSPFLSGDYRSSLGIHANGNRMQNMQSGDTSPHSIIWKPEKAGLKEGVARGAIRSRKKMVYRGDER